jgi:uncharacterized protein YjbJ (UPF0337 family)
MNKDQVAGRAKELKGTLKEKTGKMLDNPKMQSEGTADKLGGKAQKTYGDSKERLKDGIDKL